ncbi:Tn7 transposase TnsA N-terminal domain-containing protein, partial [Gillisia sp. Q332]|uniref:Tn7 transposase TnsA N-terminal domain-containing protein n=1 Tax=Gillisia xinjiangensis TaxID=3384765 RepID=UPI00391DE5B7
MIGTSEMEASIEKRLIAANSTIRLVSCADRQIAQILRPVWVDGLSTAPGSTDEIPIELDLGRPVRNTQKSNAEHAAGKLFSPKNERLMGCESHLEKRAMILLECDPTVMRYCVQPMTLRYELDGKQRHYTADNFVWRGDKLQILEIKPCTTA